VSTSDERRKLRASWPIRRFRLGDEPEHDERDLTTVAERMSLVWRLTQESWVLSGRQMPTYSRPEMPGIFVRRNR
jgi:hypothetical protein